MRRRRIALFLAGSAIAGALGCQAILGIDSTSFAPDGGSADDGSTSDGSNASDGAPADAGSGTFTISPSTVRIAPGGSADVTVSIVRTGDTSDVSVTASDLDAGVAIAPLTISSGTNSGTLHVTVPASASPGAQDIATIHASLAGAADQPLTVIVPGLPGSVDNTFAFGEATFGTASTIAVSVVVQSTGKPVVGAVPGGTTGWQIVRFNLDGTLDTAFDDSAAASIPSSGELSDIALGTHDDIYAVGGNGSQLAVYHLNSDGTRDNTFGTAGVAQLNAVDFSQGSNGLSIAVQSDDRPVALGTSGGSANLVPLLVRFATNGAWDQSFGTSGRTVLTNSQTLGGVVVLPDDRIAAAGTDSATLPLDIIVAHFTKDGPIDTAFSSSGFVRSGTGNKYTADNIAIGPDGGYLTVGDNQGSVALGCVVGLFASSGAPGSFATPSTGASYDTCTSALMQSDGHFLVTGFGGRNQQSWAYVVRMLSPTALDPTFPELLYFADHGVNPSVAFRTLHDVAIAPDGRIIAVGSQDSAGAMVVRVWP